MINDLICNLDLSTEKEKYTDLYINNSEMKKLAELRGKLINEYFVKQFCLLLNMQDINKATGYFLDLIGNRWGQSRPVVEVTPDYAIYNKDLYNKALYGTRDTKKFVGVGDDFYRKIIKLKVMNNLYNNSYENLSLKLSSVLAGSKIIDHQNMTLTYVIGDVNIKELQVLKDNGLLPRPTGVKIDIYLSTGMIYDDDNLGFYDKDLYGVEFPIT